MLQITLSSVFLGCAGVLDRTKVEGSKLVLVLGGEVAAERGLVTPVFSPYRAWIEKVFLDRESFLYRESFFRQRKIFFR